MGRNKRSRKKKLDQIIPELIRVYRYFWNDIRNQLRLIYVSFAALLFGVIFRILEPWPLKFVLDQVFVEGTDSTTSSITLPDSWSASTIILAVSLAVVAIAASRAAADYFSKVGFFKVGNYVVIRVRDRVYRHLQALPLSFHDRARHGDLITRTVRDVNLLRDVTATAILPLLGSSMVLLGMATVMIWINWKLAAVSLIVIPFYWITTVRLGRRIRETARKQRQRDSAMASIASEAISSIRAIKAHCLEDKFATDFDRKNNQSQTDDLKASRLSLRLGRTVDILLAIATACVLWLGANQILGGKLHPSDLVVFLIYLKRSFKPAQEFAKYTARIAKATAAGERVIQILEQPVEPNITSDVCLPLNEVKGAIEFRKVHFGYSDEQLVLKDFNLVVQPGKTFAITGPSGAGKSTLIGLLLRFYEPSSGQILIDGVEISSYSIASLRSAFNVVLQEPLLFAGTIRENISLGSPHEDVSDAAVRAAAQIAEVDEFALQMPDGFDATIGERAVTLSRGQQQRVAIARAALCAKPMLLLDEPTTGLDENNQSIVGDALLALAKSKTTLMVTHNLNLASRADEIIYIDHGQVCQRGSHAALLRQDGPYAEFFLQQMNCGISAKHEVKRLP